MRTSSFTSRSSAGTIPVLALAAVLSAAFSWHAKRHWQVESAFFSEAIRTSERYADSLRAGHPNLFVVFGGSTSRASWIPSVLLDEFGVPVVNFGLHAGFGPHVITELAMREAKPGDTIVVAFEPAILARDETTPPTGGADLFLHEDGLSFRPADERSRHVVALLDPEVLHGQVKRAEFRLAFRAEGGLQRDRTRHRECDHVARFRIVVAFRELPKISGHPSLEVVLFPGG